MIFVYGYSPLEMNSLRFTHYETTEQLKHLKQFFYPHTHARTHARTHTGAHEVVYVKNDDFSDTRKS